MENDILARPLKDAAESLGVSISTIYRLAEQGKVIIIKIGGRSLVTEASRRSLISDAPKLKIRRAGNAQAKVNV